MRLTPSAIQKIKATVASLLGSTAQVRLFGSRLDKEKKGGDVDLLVTTNTPVESPAVLTAQLAARLIQALEGRKVDVLLDAPNLKKQPIHFIAEEEGKLL